MEIEEWRVLTSARCARLSAVTVTSERCPKHLSDACEGTLYDSRMGPRFEGDACGTCGGTFRQCKLGHHGLIHLRSHVFVAQFMPHVVRALRSVCKTCLRVKSPSCALREDKKKCVGFSSVRADNSEGCLRVEDNRWSASDAFTFLTNVHWGDLVFDPTRPKPHDMIFDSVLVLPNNARPAHVSSDAKHTVLRAHRYMEPYVKLLKLTKKREQLLGRTLELRYHDKEMYEALNMLLVCAKPGRAAPSTSGVDDSTGILSSLVSKTGLIRNNLMGKRVDFSARGVACGDPTLRVDEFGLPRVWRNKLTIPVRVNKYNLHAMRDVVRSGEWMTLVKKGGSVQYDADVMRRHDALADRLAFGDVVDRWLRDGDPVILIRQPTLHKGSMMCGKVRLHDRLTVEMNVNVTTPFNGDFDGDEFNAFVPRSEGAFAEFEELFAVKHQIVNENGACQIYLIQNAVLGMYRATSEKPGCVPLLGPGIVTEAQCRERIRRIWFDEGHDAAVRAIQEASDFANEWLERRGASLGLNEFDCVRLDPALESDGALLRAHKLRAREIVRNLEDESYGERRAFNEASAFVTNEVRPWDRALRDMRMSGCKGGDTNELNVALVLGRQAVCDAAPKPVFAGKYMLPCGVERGFVPVGYVRGLRPEHTALHQMSGRYGVYIKSVGVKECGHRYREMGQCMENLVVSVTGGCVLDEVGNVVQIVYGEDGLDPKMVRRETGLPVREWEWYSSSEEEPVPEWMRDNNERARAYFAGRATAPASLIREWCLALVPYGHAVGIIAAQSISEPATQETLNSFHVSGAAGGNGEKKKSSLRRLFKPMGGSVTDAEIRGETAPGARAPPTLASWTWQKSAPREEEWTRRFDGFVPGFPRESAGGYLALVLEDGLDDVLGALARVPHPARASHPSLDAGPVRMHVALPEGAPASPAAWFALPCVSAATTTAAAAAAAAKGGARVRVVSGSSEFSASGVDFRTILNQPWVRTAWSEDAMAVAEVLGIEAARAMLVREFVKTFAGKVDVRHVMLMVDAMTYTGAVRSMDYFGFKASASGSVLGRACFRRALETFFDAAATNKVEDDRRGPNVSESVVTGSLVRLGTGGVTLVMDTDALMRIPEDEAEEEEEEGIQAGREKTSEENPSPLSPCAWGPTLGPVFPFSPTYEEPQYVRGDEEDEEPQYVREGDEEEEGGKRPSDAPYSPSDAHYDPYGEEDEGDEAYDPCSSAYEPGVKRAKSEPHNHRN